MREELILESKLLDLRDCSKEYFKRIYDEMLRISLFEQPRWFRPLLMRSRYFQRVVGYNHWSRAWEYPWAILVSEIKGPSLRILDVGGGGSPFAIYLDQHGHEATVIDPSLDQGLKATLNRNKGIYRNIKSFIFQLVLKITGVRRVWGKQSRSKKNSVRYYPYSAEDIRIPSKYFDRVFCLSVMEHIPVKLWDQCIKEFERVLKPGGRLIITLDMSTPNADNRLYLKLVDCCSLRLIGEPYYDVPISQADKQVRHPRHTYETIGLVWQG
jgi:ubiquinone/menaquinone biosynthesis C-methylase UbiE